MRGEARVEDTRLTRGWRSRKSATACALRVVSRHADRQRLQAAPQLVCRLRVEHGPEQPPHVFDTPANELARPGNHARGDVAVPAEVLRRRVHDEVHAERQRLLVHRAWRTCCRGPRARPARGMRPRRAPMSTQRSTGFTGDSNQNEPRLRPEIRVGILPAPRARRTARESPNFTSRSHEQLHGAAVERGGAHDLVARLGQRHEGRGHRSHARREHERGVSALERGQLALDADDGRVLVARVEILARAPFVVGLYLAPPRRRRTSRSGRWVSSAERPRSSAPSPA